MDHAEKRGKKFCDNRKDKSKKILVKALHHLHQNYEQTVEEVKN